MTTRSFWLTFIISSCWFLPLGQSFAEAAATTGIPLPVAYWRLAENGITNDVHDTTGNGHDGTLKTYSGDAATADHHVPGLSGGALIFSGVQQDRVQIGGENDDPIIPVGSPFTISAWIRPDEVDGYRMIYGYSSNSGDAYLAYSLCIYGGDLRAMIGNGNGVQYFVDLDGGQNLSPSRWYHVAVVFDDAGDSPAEAPELRAYINGRLTNVIEVTLTGVFPAAGLPGKKYEVIGGHHPWEDNRYFSGIIDEVKVWDVAVTSDQVAREAAAPNPRAYWRMTENYSTSTVADATGNSYHADLNSDNSTSTDIHHRLGLLDGAFSLDASQREYMQIGDLNDEPIIPVGSPFTISAWIRPNAVDGYRMIYGHASSSSNAYLAYSVCIYEGDLRAMIGNGSEVQHFRDLDGGQNLSPSKWYHVTVVFDDSDEMQGTTPQLRAYVNGKLTKAIEVTLTGEFPKAGEYGNKYELIGADYNGKYRNFSGLIDEIKVWSEPLTEAQVANEFGDGMPVAHWRLGDNQMSVNVLDSLDGARHGEFIDPSGSPYTTDHAVAFGAVGMALTFDGVDDRVQIGDVNGDPIIPAGSPFTISAWIRPDAVDGYRMIYGHASSSSNAYLAYSVCIYEGDLRAMIGNGSEVQHFRDLDGGQNLSPSKWYHVTVVFDDSDEMQGTTPQLRAYVNGKLTKAIEVTLTGEFPKAGEYGNKYELIGADYNGKYRNYAGLIDEVKVWRRAISNSEVAHQATQLPYLFDASVMTESAVMGATPIPHVTSLESSWKHVFDHQYRNDSGWLGLLLKGDDPYGGTGPYYGTDTEALESTLSYLGSKGYPLHFVFTDFESAHADENVRRTVEKVREHYSPLINAAYIGNYDDHAGNYNYYEPWGVIVRKHRSEATGEVIDSHEFYMSSGMNVSMPVAYPNSVYANHFHRADIFDDNLCVSERHALFWAPLERFSTAQRALPPGHLNIPWLAGFIAVNGYPAIPPSRNDNAALLKHLRLRGANGYYLYGPGQNTNYSSSKDYREHMYSNGWKSLDWFFDNVGEMNVLNTETNKTGGVEWSGACREKQCLFVFSNFTDGSVQIELPDIEGLPNLSPTIEGGAHLVRDYVLD